LLVMGAISFAAPNVAWISPTPVNDSEYWGDAFQIIFNTSSEMNATGNYIEIDGVNNTCSLSPDSLQCSYTLNYSEKIYNNTYDIKGYANISGTPYVTNETRVIYYVGCGLISGDQSLMQNVGSDAYPDEDCFTISANNTLINCEGYTITLANNTNSDAFTATNKFNLVIEDCIVESGYRAIHFDNVDYSTITNNVFNNQTWDAVAFDNTNNSNMTYNNFNMDYESHNDIYGFNCIDDCNGNNLFYNNMSNGAVGINNEGNDTAIWRNNISNMDDSGIEIDGSPLGGGNTISDNEVYNCDVGIEAEDMTIFVLAYNHVYNTSGAIYFANTQDVNTTYIEVTDEIDRPAGGYINYSVLSILDIMLPNSAYYIDWAPVTVTPSGRGSFLGKQVGCSAAPEGVNYNVTLIDVLVFTWTNPEVVGYDESQIELWGIDVNGTAVLLNDTPGTGTNSIATYNFRMEDYDSLGLYYHGNQTIPNVPGNLTDQEAMALMSTFISAALIFIVLFIIVGSFGLSKWFDFKEIFVPLMVAVLIVILALGLFA